MKRSDAYWEARSAFERARLLHERSLTALAFAKAFHRCVGDAEWLVAASGIQLSLARARYFALR